MIHGHQRQGSVKIPFMTEEKTPQMALVASLLITQSWEKVTENPDAGMRFFS